MFFVSVCNFVSWNESIASSLIPPCMLGVEKWAELVIEVRMAIDADATTGLVN